MTSNPIQLGIYRHYKGNDYEVIGFSKHSETLEDMVVYKTLYGERGTWVRPSSMWNNTINIDGKTVKRFEYVGEADRHHGLAEAYSALLSTLKKCEKIDLDKLGKSQKALLERRIAALKLALTLIEKEQNT
jgi:hypothetical protein